MNLPYPSVQDAAIALKTKYFSGFHILPYNRFDIDHSRHWWLSPTGDKAAFRYGKVVLTTDEPCRDPSKVFCGFQVEKGVEHNNGWSKSHLMQDDWFWHDFLELANIPLASAIEQARESVSCPLQVYMDCGMLVRDSNWDRLLFESDATILTKTSYDRADGVLDRAAAATDFVGFADALRALDGTATGWHWIDVVIGMVFSLDPSGPDDTCQCAAMLNPFRTWMRAAA